MANKRILKKQINYACIDMGANCIVASALRSGIDETAINAVLDKIASLQTKTLKNINIAFDKAPRDFDSINEYKKERSQRHTHRSARTSTKKSRKSLKT